jgi:hypothetical protein
MPEGVRLAELTCHELDGGMKRGKLNEFLSSIF